MAMLMPVMWIVLGMTVPLSGTVVDADGRPVAGATVWLGDTHWGRHGPEVLATAQTDDRGHFQLERADELSGRVSQWSPTLWAYKPGSRVAFLEFKRKLPGSDQPVRLVLGPPVATALRVLQADGKPAAKAKVQVVELSLKAPRPPDKMLDRFVATTDANGRATLDGFAPADIFALYVTAAGQIVQALSIDPGSGTVKLRPVGRLKARIVADDPRPNALRGWMITAQSRPTEPGYVGPYITHWIRKTTGDDGRVEFPSIAEGQIDWNIKPPEGSNYLVVKEPAAAIRAGGTEDVEIKVVRAVRVEGTVLDEPDGAPVPRVTIDLDPLMHSGSVNRFVTDAQGHFSTLIRPGQARFIYWPYDIPKTHFMPPGKPGWADFDVKEGVERQTFTPPRLHKAAQVRGKVVDEAGKPVAGVSIEGSLTTGDYEQHPNTVRAETDARGEFVLGCIAPKAEVRLSASWRSAADAAGTISRAGEGEPITLHLRKRPTLALSGRVMGSDGRALASAVVRVWIRPPSHGGPGAEFAFDGLEELRTGPDGRFRTPDQVPVGNAYRIEAEAPGYESKGSDWVVAPAAEVPELKLRRSMVVHEVAGRVIDSAGKPVAGAEVFQSGDGPRRTQGTTDNDGRFRVPGVPDTPAFLFVSKEGYHFIGRRVEPADRTVEFALRRLDEPPAALLRSAASPVARDEERAIGRTLLVEARKSLSDAPDLPEHRQVLEVTALVDPDRVIEMIENQVIKTEPGLLRGLAVARSEGDPRKALEVLDGISEPYQASFAGLELFDILGATVPPEFRRELLDRVAKRAREIKELEPAANQLARKLQGAQTQFDAIQDQLDTIRAGIAEKIAVPDPTLWRSSSLSEDQLKRRVACLRMAAQDLPVARALAAEDHDPMVEALLPAIAARTRAGADPDGARALLRESVERLGKLGDGLTVHPSPPVAMARLLPTAIRIDPDRAPDYLWLALSRRPSVSALYEPVASNPSTLHAYLDLVELAVLAARYDRAAAEVVFAPVAIRLVGLNDEQWGIGNECPAMFRAVGAYDARVARTLLDSLPKDPAPNAATSGFRFRRQAHVRIALARILGLSPALRLREPFLPDDSHWLGVLED